MVISFIWLKWCVFLFFSARLEIKSWLFLMVNTDPTLKFLCLTEDLSLRRHKMGYYVMGLPRNHM